MTDTSLGGWELDRLESCSLPQQVASGFGKVVQGLVGAEYEPVLYVGSRLVHGTDHMILCEQTLSAPGAPKHLVKMVLNQAHDDGSMEGQWSLVGIERIV